MKVGWDKRAERAAAYRGIRHQASKVAPLVGMERLEPRQLLSGQSAVITDATPYEITSVNGVYRDVLGRSADFAGLNWFVQQLDQGQSTGTVASVLLSTNEYAAEVVRSSYQQYLGRTPDPSAVNYWVNSLRDGFRDEQLVAALVASDEFYLRAGGNDASWVTALCQALLDRPPDPGGAAWLMDQLAAGVSRTALAHAVATSIEHEGQVVAGIIDHYQGVTLETGAPASWTWLLATGQKTDEDLIRYIAGTFAYYQAQTGVPPTVVPVPSQLPGWAEADAKVAAGASHGNAQVLFLGDSITSHWQDDGQAVWDQYFAGLASFDAGILGDTTQNLLYRIEAGSLNGLAPKEVVLMIGVNDIAHATPQDVSAGVTADVNALRQCFPDAKILLLSILPTVFPFPGGNLMPPIAATNQLLGGLADGQHVFYLDLWPFFTNPDGSFRPELHVSDGLHLNAQGYAVLGQAIAPDVDYFLSAR